jgi:hypothetical protein
MTVRPRRLSRRWAVIGVFGLLVAIVTFDLTRLLLDLRAARADADRLVAALSGSDVGSVRGVAGDLEAHSAAAHRHSDALAFRFASYLPLVGEDVRTVRRLASVLDRTARESVSPALTLLDATSGGGLRTADGRFDLAKIASLAPTVHRLADATARASAQVAPLRPRSLVLPPVRSLTTKAQSAINELNATARAGDAAVQLMPAMMGQTGPRRYLLVVQNSAESRASGGLIGSLTPITVDDGKLTIGKQIPNNPFREAYSTPVIPLTRDEDTVYGPTLGEDLRDTNLTPDFPRTSQLIQAMYTGRYHHAIDGVIAVDPVALSLVLRATGPVRAGAETFTGANVVRKLLHDVYQRYPEDADQNAYFSAAASAIFQGISQGQGDERSLLKQVVTAADQGRLLVWSDHPEEQELLDGTTVGATLARRGTLTDVGVYLNDTSVAKMQYYLRYQGSVRSLGCSSAGQVIEARMQMHSVAPEDISGVVPYITGGGKHTPLGSMRFQVRFYSPPEGELTSITANGDPVRLATSEQDGRQVALVDVVLKQQQAVDFRVRFRSQPGADGDPQLRWTPGMTVQPNQVTSYSACG